MKTMTVKELCAFLQTYPEEWPVWAEWEGVKAGIDSNNFTTEDVDGKPALVIDVNDYR